MNKTIKKIIGWSDWLILAIALILVFYSLVYWIMNPELSKMQVFFACWKQSLIAVVLLIYLKFRGW